MADIYELVQKHLDFYKKHARIRTQRYLLINSVYNFLDQIFAFFICFLLKLWQLLSQIYILSKISDKNGHTFEKIQKCKNLILWVVDTIERYLWAKFQSSSMFFVKVLAFFVIFRKLRFSEKWSNLTKKPQNFSNFDILLT